MLLFCATSAATTPRPRFRLASRAGRGARAGAEAASAHAREEELLEAAPAALLRHLAHAVGAELAEPKRQPAQRRDRLAGAARHLLLAAAHEVLPAQPLQRVDVRDARRLGALDDDDTRPADLAQAGEAEL